MLLRITWFIIYFVSTEGFGMRMDSWGGLGTPLIGWYGVLQILVAATSVAAVLPGLINLNRIKNSALGAVLFLIGLIPFYMICVTAIRSILDSDISIGEATTNLVKMKFFLMIYLFTTITKTRKQVEIALSALKTYALISAISIIVIIMFRLDTAVSAVTTSSDVTRTFRVIFPGSLLVAAGWLLLLSRYIALGGINNLLYSIICLTATVIQLHRGTLLSVGAASIVLIIWFLAPRIHAGGRKSILFILLVISSITVSYYIIFVSEISYAYITASIGEILNVAASFRHRLLLVVNSWNYVNAETYGLGVGLDWERVDDFAKYIDISFVAGPTLDSTYANIVIVLGLPGIAISAWLFLRIYRLASSLRKNNVMPSAKMFGIFFGSFLVYIVAIGLSTDFVLISSSAATFWVITILAARLQNIELARRRS